MIKGDRQHVSDSWVEGILVDTGRRHPYGYQDMARISVWYGIGFRKGTSLGYLQKSVD